MVDCAVVVAATRSTIDTKSTDFDGAVVLLESRAFRQNPT